MATALCPPWVLLGPPHNRRTGTGLPWPRCEVRSPETGSRKVSGGPSGRRGYRGPASSEVPGLGRLPRLLRPAVAAAGCRLPAPAGRPPAGMRGRLSGRVLAEQCAVCAAAAGARHAAHGEEAAAGSRPAWGSSAGHPPPVTPPAAGPGAQRALGPRGWHSSALEPPCPCLGTGVRRRGSRSARPRGGAGGAVSRGGCDHRPRAQQRTSPTPRQQMAEGSLAQGKERSDRAREGSAPGQGHPHKVRGAPRAALCVTQCHL